MNPKNEHKETTRPSRKRFRIEKLEERIAPTKGGKGTNKNCTGNCAYTGSGSLECTSIY